MACVPTGRVAVVRVAVPLAERVAVPRSVLVVLSKKSTLAVGLDPEPSGRTLAVKVNPWPKSAEAAEEVREVNVREAAGGRGVPLLSKVLPAAGIGLGVVF